MPPLIRYGIDGVPALDVILDALTVTEGAIDVDVWAPAGAVVEVVDADAGTTLGAGVVGASGTLSVPLSQPLLIGRKYVARLAGQSLPAAGSVTCVCRHGFPETFASGETIDATYYQHGAIIGQPFIVEVGVQSASEDMLYEGVMLIGFRLGGVDPLVAYGNNLLLAASVAMPAQGVAIGAGSGMLFSSLTIPNDPGLVGLIFLTQFAMEDGQDYVLSQVYGSLIEVGQAQTASAQTATTPNAFAAIVADQHLEQSLASGKVIDATSTLFQILTRRL